MARWPGDPHRERTSFARLSRSALMARVRSTGNRTTELRFVALMRKAGVTGWRRRRPIFGRPDFVWQAFRVAVFIDGCFWHGHKCGRNLSPETNASVWDEKFERNRARDRKVTRSLRSQGWRVLRIWECTLARKPDHCVARVRQALNSVVRNRRFSESLSRAPAASRRSGQESKERR